MVVHLVGASELAATATIPVDGEQQTLFIKDPSGNHLAFKSFRNIEMLFASDGLDYP